MERKLTPSELELLGDEPDRLRFYTELCDSVVSILPPDFVQTPYVPEVKHE